MRPFTKAVFEREGKHIVGSRWTLDQVERAYQKADELLDYIAEYDVFEHAQKEKDWEKIRPDFEKGMEERVAKNLPYEALQSLSLNILWELLERGRYILRTAARIYKDEPDTFRTRYASSKQAFYKDKFFLKKVPFYSFSPFKTGDNPALIHSKTCADLYNSVDKLYLENKISKNYILWSASPAGNKLSSETAWVQNVALTLRHKKINSYERTFDAFSAAWSRARTECL